MKASQLVEIKEKAGCTLHQFECPANWANEVVRFSKLCKQNNVFVVFWVCRDETNKFLCLDFSDAISFIIQYEPKYLYEHSTGTFYKIERPKGETDSGPDQTKPDATN